MGTGMGRRGVVWKTPDITADGLKIFAWAMMLFQYIGVIIVEKGMIRLEQYTQEELSAALAEDSHLMMLAGVGSVLQLLGGMAIPLFAFLLVEGFRNTSSYKKYLAAVAFFALISEVPYDFAMKSNAYLSFHAVRTAPCKKIQWFFEENNAVLYCSGSSYVGWFFPGRIWALHGTFNVCILYFLREKRVENSFGSNHQSHVRNRSAVLLRYLVLQRGAQR